MGNIRLTGLQPGDILLSKINEAYIYMGYYSGKIYGSMYYNNTEGYLYIFLSSVTYSTSKGVTKVNDILRQIESISKIGIDGLGCYTKNPKTFTEKIGHIDLSAIHNIREYPFNGIKLVGDRKPLKHRFSVRNK